jgi:hypothetical protein
VRTSRATPANIHDKVHARHRKSDYISDVELKETRDAEGRPDREMLYTPGRKTKAEFRSLGRALRTQGLTSIAGGEEGGDKLRAAARTQSGATRP